jgi:transposase-like protein
MKSMRSSCFWDSRYQLGWTQLTTFVPKRSQWSTEPQKDPRRTGTMTKHRRAKIVGEAENSMVTTTVHCPHCGSEEIMRYGRSPNGKQKYRCKTCKRQSREHPTPLAYPEERREEILRAYEERSSLRGLERTFGVSRTSVIGWIKKSRKAARAERNGAHT